MTTLMDKTSADGEMPAKAPRRASLVERAAQRLGTAARPGPPPGRPARPARAAAGVALMVRTAEAARARRPARLVACRSGSRLTSTAFRPKAW